MQKATENNTKTNKAIDDEKDIAKEISTTISQSGEVLKYEEKNIDISLNFWKLSIYSFTHKLNKINNKQLAVVLYILDNTNPSDNTFIGTYKNISDKVKCSLDTITRVINSLLISDFMRKKQNGVYVINPYVLVKGNEKKKAMIYSKYKELELKQPSNIKEKQKRKKTSDNTDTPQKSETSTKTETKTDTKTNADTNNETDK